MTLEDVELEAVEEAEQLSHRQYVIQELEHLIGTDGPDSISRRLGYKDAVSLTRSLMRWGRSDLASALAVAPLYPRDVNVVRPPPRKRTSRSKRRS